MSSDISQWPPQEAKKTRLADEMFIEMVIRCDCLRDQHLKILSTLADKFLQQVQAQIGNQKTQDG